MARIVFFDAESGIETGEADGDIAVGLIVSNLAQAGIKRRKGNFGEGWVRDGESDELHVWMFEREPEPAENLDTTDGSTAEDQTTTEEP